eukprot:jgi/Botrbrau1/15560/Bobra.0274s0004.1
MPYQINPDFENVRAAQSHTLDGHIIRFGRRVTRGQNFTRKVKVRVGSFHGKPLSSLHLHAKFFKDLLPFS